MQRRTGTSPGGGPRTDDRANRRHADLRADVPAPLRFGAAGRGVTKDVSLSDTYVGHQRIILDGRPQ